MRAQRRAGERGSASLELVVMAPLLLLFIGVMIFGGRVALEDQRGEVRHRRSSRIAFES